MIVNLDRYDLERLVKSISINYIDFGNELVKKAGHSYSEPYGRTYWDNLDKLTDDELFDLYKLCKK